MHNQLKSICIDWFQMNCKFPHTTEYSDMSVSRWNQEVYEVHRRDEGTKIFEVVEYIFQKVGTRQGRLIATACSIPRSKIIAPDMILIKFENDILYDKNFDFVVQEFLSYNRLIFVGISRLDIALDFNFFERTHKQGRPRDPQKFITDFHQMKIVKMGRGKGKSHYEIGRRLTYDYMRFGGKDSPVSAYMYNKSKELRQVKMKPHIVDQWEAVGLDIKKVWRVEFSIKGARKVLQNLSSKENIDFHTLEILKVDNIKLLFDCLMKTYFSFAKETGDINKSRLPKINLFNPLNTEASGVIVERTDQMESNHMDAFMCNKLYTIATHELKGTESDIEKHVQNSAVILRSYFMQKRDLERKKRLYSDKIKIGNPDFKVISMENENLEPNNEEPPPELMDDEFNFNN